MRGRPQTADRRPQFGLGVKLTQRWHVRLWEDASRQKLLWETVIKNLVTTQGKNKYLDATLKTGLTGPVWYVGLVNNAGFTAYAVGDTAAKITTRAARVCATTASVLGDGRRGCSFSGSSSSADAASPPPLISRQK